MRQGAYVMDGKMRAHATMRCVFARLGISYLGVGELDGLA